MYRYTHPRRPVEAGRPVVTVGPDNAMFRGRDHLAIQGAVDYVARLGGGIVRIQPGTYTLRNAVFLSGDITLEGAGADTILQKDPSANATMPLAEDLDWYAWGVKVADPSCWRTGDGIMLTSIPLHGGEHRQVSRHTIVAIENGILQLDNPPRINHWLVNHPEAVPVHSLIEVQRASHIVIRDLELQGHREAVPEIDGNYGAAIFLHDGEQVQIRNVGITAFHGDGISWQIVHDVTVEDCRIRDISNLAMHPGSGSQRPVIRSNTITGATDGIFWCWGARDGRAEDNIIADCRRDGISTGHRDTDNANVGNRITNCGRAGIFFREERRAELTSHRVRVEDNEISWSREQPEAAGIVVARGVEDAVIRGNRITTPLGLGARAIAVSPEAIRAVVADNVVRES